MLKRRYALRSGGILLAPIVLLGGCPPPSNPPPPPATTAPPPVTTAPPPVTTAPPPATAQFVATFDTANDFYGRFQLQTMDSRARTISEWHGDHNTACAAPTTLRTVRPSHQPAPGNLRHDGPSEQFWWCAPGGPSTGHVMTSLMTDGYGQVNFSPNRAFSRVTEVCWRQNQTDMGGRKWTQMAVVPEDIYQANGRRLDYVDPDLFANNGPAAAGILPQRDVFLFNHLGGSTRTYVGPNNVGVNWDGFRISDKAQRFRTCVRDLENGTVRIRMERLDRNGALIEVVRALPGSLPNGSARVIFQDDTYDAPKGTLGLRLDMATWHWDDIVIS